MKRKKWVVYEGGNFCKVAIEGYDKEVEKTNFLGGPLCIVFKDR